MYVLLDSDGSMFGFGGVLVVFALLLIVGPVGR
jgi:hypothetical protein